MRKFLTYAMSGIGSVVSLVAALGFVPGVWLFDLASQLRVLYAPILLVCLIALVLLRSRIGVVIVLIGSLLNAAPIVSMYQSESRVIEKDQTSISILNFNTEFQHNDRYDLFNSLVAERDPDIVVLVEVDKKWIDAIEPAMKRFPHKETFIAGPGMAFFSKFPIERCEARYFGLSHHPRIAATLSIDGRPVQLMIAHPTTPKSENGFSERNQELSIIQNEMASLSSPKLLIGDLNCGPWSPAFSQLLSVGGLLDSEQGFGPQPSWPARSGRLVEGVPIPPLVPIDHVLVSRDTVVQSRVAGPAIGADHLPVFLRVALPK